MDAIPENLKYDIMLWESYVNEEDLNEGKDDYMARYGKTDIMIKKGYKVADEGDLEDLYVKLGELAAELGFGVKNITVVAEGKTTWQDVMEHIESIGEGDEQSDEMAYGQLERCIDYAKMLRDRYDQGFTFDSWMYGKITKAKDYLNTVFDALDGGDGEIEEVQEGMNKAAIKKQIKIIDQQIEDEEGGDGEPLTNETLAELERERERLQKMLESNIQVNENLKSDIKTYQRQRKLGYNDQFHGDQSLAYTLSLDLGMDPDNEFGGGDWLGFDHVSLYVNGGKKEGTILDDALAGKHTYDDLKSAAAEFLGIKENVNEDLKNDVKKYIKKNQKDLDAMADADQWDQIYNMLYTDFDVEPDSDDAQELKTVFSVTY